VAELEQTNYVLGHSLHEQERLMLQGRILRQYTEKYFRAAGLGPGMRVLDVGCGIGDVALLVADIVGPSGQVTCIDRDPEAIARAQHRVIHCGCSSWVNFQQSSLQDLVVEEKFDALVGRYILLYQSDPAAVLRRLCGFLQTGGIVAFHEVDFSESRPSSPCCPVFDQVYRALGAAFLGMGVDPGYGRGVGHTFLQAGLPFPTIACDVVIGGGRGSYMYPWLANTIISVAPRLEQLGIALPPGVTADDKLAVLLEEEVGSKGSQILGPTQYGAWCRIP
jgi:ubiquinone/menaquinone biosynthesis C-methylase UbiE